MNWNPDLNVLTIRPIFEKEAGRCITHYFAPVPEGQKFVTVIAGCDSATVYADQKSGTG